MQKAKTALQIKDKLQSGDLRQVAQITGYSYPTVKAITNGSRNHDTAAGAVILKALNDLVLAREIAARIVEKMGQVDVGEQERDLEAVEK